MNLALRSCPLRANTSEQNAGGQLGRSAWPNLNLIEKATGDRAGCARARPRLRSMFIASPRGALNEDGESGGLACRLGGLSRASLSPLGFSPQQRNLFVGA
jgi:hypothetical protein